MLDHSTRTQAVQTLLGEIARTTDRGDFAATLIQIRAYLQHGVITTRDAERLETMLSGVQPEHGADLL